MFKGLTLTTSLSFTWYTANDAGPFPLLSNSMFPPDIPEKMVDQIIPGKSTSCSWASEQKLLSVQYISTKVLRPWLKARIEFMNNCPSYWKEFQNTSCKQFWLCELFPHSPCALSMWKGAFLSICSIISVYKARVIRRIWIDNDWILQYILDMSE